MYHVTDDYESYLAKQQQIMLLLRVPTLKSRLAFISQKILCIIYRLANMNSRENIGTILSSPMTKIPQSSMLQFNQIQISKYLDCPCSFNLKNVFKFCSRNRRRAKCSVSIRIWAKPQSLFSFN